MMNISTISKQILLLTILILIYIFPVIAQDDANFDNTFGMIFPAIPPELLLSDVLTSDDGFDNFFIGIDRAEPHISANINTPTEYFTAFNTNGTHYTYDGHDWFTQIPPFGTDVRGDPCTAYDSLGNLYYETMYGDPGIVGCKVIVSTDNGATWSPAVTSIAGNDKNWIAADQTAGPYANHVYTTMTQGSGHAVARSTDFGQTWSQTGFFSSSPRPGAMVAVGPNTIGGDIPGGAVYVVTNHTSTFAPLYSFYLSTNGGANWVLKSTQQFANYVGTDVNGRHSVENMRTRPYPFITADNSYGSFRGRLYLVYASNNPVGNGNKPDIYCRFSDDQGVTWSSPVTVNDDPNSTANHQWMPATWCDKETGRLYIKWFDTRNVPSSDSAEVYASYSDDGGITWVQNQNLSTSKFKIDCSTCGGGGTPRYQGDYDAITSNKITSMSVWSDFRNGAFGSYVAYFPDYAMTISPSVDTMRTTDSLEITINIPAVKLYDKSVKFSAEVNPAANFSFSFPQGDSLTSFPDSISMTIYANNVANDTYSVTISGRGPNETPVHKRTVTILATEPTTTVVQPNGGEELIVGTRYPVTWEKIFVDTVKLEYSTDGGSSWNLITENAISSTSPIIHPKKIIDPNYFSDEIENTWQYDWTVPNTISSDCLLRASDKNNPLVFDVSDASFSIISAPSPLWRLQNSGIDSTILCVDIVDTLLAWAGTKGGTVLKTTDGGINWNIASSSLGGDVYSIAAIDNQRAIVIVNSPGSTRIRRTVSFGVSWGTVYEDTSPGAFLNAIHMFDEENGYAVGDPVNGEWILLNTSDVGATWNSAASINQVGVESGWSNSMDWIGDQYGWFGTDDGRVYLTTDGGNAWQSSQTSFTNSIAIAFNDDQNGVAGGDGTDITTDGGISWTVSPNQIPGTTFSGTSIKESPGRWYFVSGNEVYKSYNGESFTLDYNQANIFQHIKIKVVAAGDNNWVCGYAVGDNGTIAKYTEPFTITNVKNNSTILPQEFTLKQNYPNPFNPSTTIEFSLPVNANVKIVIYNLLGQEVATILNETRNAGNHSIVWNSTNSESYQLSSGIYFYEINAEGIDGKNFHEFRKMVLIK